MTDHPLLAIRHHFTERISGFEEDRGWDQKMTRFIEAIDDALSDLSARSIRTKYPLSILTDADAVKLARSLFVDKDAAHLTREQIIALAQAVIDSASPEELPIPDGWKLVPTTPTAGMHGAGDGAIDKALGAPWRGTWLGGKVWKAMLAAAPAR